MCLLWERIYDMGKRDCLFSPFDFSTPVVILDSGWHSLGVARSLGRLGAQVYGMSGSRDASTLSKYFHEYFFTEINPSTPDEQVVDILLEAYRKIGKIAVLVTVSDYLATLIGRNSKRLGDFFLIPKVNGELVENLSNKHTMSLLAKENHVPTSEAIFPQNLKDVDEFGKKAKYPVVLKGIDGTLLQRRNNTRMVIARSFSELIEAYKLLEDPQSPDLLIQEHIPFQRGSDWLFNGYFDHQSNCVASFTGIKIRQRTVYAGPASLGECRENKMVESMSINFLRAVGYQGVVDIDYRYDHRDGQYKILDVNPRVGGSFRLFVGKGGVDVVRALYLEMTGQKVPNDTQIEGRKWVEEEGDLLFWPKYFRDGLLSFGEWIRSFRGVRERAWFAIDDPYTFVIRGLQFASPLFTKFLKPHLDRASKKVKDLFVKD